MYPEPHIPSAPTESAVAEPERFTSLLLASSLALLLLAVLCFGIRVMTQTDRPAESNPSTDINDHVVGHEQSDSNWETRFSTRGYPTRLP